MTNRSDRRRNVSRLGFKEESRPDYESRIGEMIEPQPDGCWHFTGGTNADGYGVVWCGRQAMLAHRYVYDTLTDGIDDGMILHHECHVKNCVNPAHLTPMTPSEHTGHHHDLRAASAA